MRDTPRPGDVFEGHLIEGEIGRGGMGMVFRARSVALDRPRAIKVIAPELSADPAYATRFRRESRLAASVEHPNVVTVHSAGEDDGMLFIVMRLVEGFDLHRLLQEGPLPPQRAIPILAGVAAALDAAHSAGLVHRDVKPANVLIESRGGGEHAYLTDFGISKPIGTKTTGAGDRTSGPPLTAEGQVLGTSDYVAPEQVEHGSSDTRSDIYSLACVVYHVLCGAPPFRRETEVATLIAQTKAERPSASAANPALPASIDGTLRRAMAMDPSQRPATAGALVAELESALGEGSTPIRASRPAFAGSEAPTAAMARSGRGGRGRRSLRIVAATAAVVLLGGAVVAVLLAGGEDGPEVVTEGVGQSPVGIAVGERRVWVASRDAAQSTGGPAGQMERLRRSRPTQGNPPIPLPRPRAVAIGLGSTWVVNGEALFQVGGGQQPRRIEVGRNPIDVAVDNEYVWVVNKRDDSVTRIDPSTLAAPGGPEAKTIAVGDGPRSIATGSKTVWVANAVSGTVSKIRRDSPRVNATIPVGPDPVAVAVGPSAAWVTDGEEDALSKIDLRKAELEGPPIPVAAGLRGVAVGLSSVWVASGAESVVARFNGSTGEPIGDPIEVGGGPADITVGESAVYTANERGNSVTRIQP